MTDEFGDSILDFIEYHKLNITKVDELSDAIYIGDRPFIPIDSSKLFDSDMKLIVDNYEKSEAEGINADYVYEFGGNYYWTSRTSKSIEFNHFRYIGICKQNIDDEFSHLGVHGGYEIMNGSGTYHDWCEKAKFFGHKALGICEYNTLAGVVAFQSECKDFKIKPIIGMTINVVHGYSWKNKCKVFVKNSIGWKNILKLHKHINIDGDGDTVELEFVIKHMPGLVFIFGWGSLIDSDIYRLLPKKMMDDVYYQIDSVIYVDENLEKSTLNNAKVYIKSYLDKINPILINDTYYLDKDYSHIKNKLNSSGGKFQNRVTNAYYKNLDDTVGFLEVLFESDDDRLDTILRLAVDNVSKVVGDIGFVVETGVVKMPRFECDKVEGAYSGYNNNEELFYKLIVDGLSKLVGRIGDSKYELYAERVAVEVNTIKKGGFIDYFLVVWDIIKWSSDNGIYTGIGRGSAGGCMIAYLLDITRIDPIEYNLPFERFMNEGRMAGSLPDIDSDFEGMRRDDVKRYIESKYGADYVCSIGSYSKLRVKAAMNEMWSDKSKTGTIKYATAMIMDRDGDWDEIFRSANKRPRLKEFVLDNVEFINNVRIVLDQPKNVSMHAAGIVIFPKHDADGNKMTIFDWIPVTKRDGVLVSEWEGTYLEKCGFMKNDILGTRQLDKFRYITDLINKTAHVDVDIYSVPVDDKLVYDLFSEGYTEDTFHFGSKGLKSYTRSVKPKVIGDLVDTISLHRPALMDIGAHKEFVNIRFGISEAHYDFMLEDITKGTNGILVYQEQVMEAVKQIGGFTMQEADDVRRAMGKKKIEVITPYKNQFIKGAIERGCPPDQASALWNKLELFSGYGFNRCISGNSLLKRLGTNRGSEITVGDMYKTLNDRNWALLNNKLALRKRYRANGYGIAWSIGADSRLYKNRIIDIRYVGKRETFKVTTESGRYIDVTMNHKFPTSNGEKTLATISIGIDMLYIDCGYDNEYKESSLKKVKGGDYRKLQSRKGKEGFQKLLGDSGREISIIQENAPGECSRCHISHTRIEAHHINEDRSNNSPDNIEYLCPSCHKKEHYSRGRTKQGESGLLTKLEHIVNISSNGIEDVYDIEMAAPNHTFTVNTGIVTSNSHATAYAMTGYVGMWMKAHYPIQFWTAAFEYAKDEDIPNFVSEMHRHSDVKIAPPDINMSDGGFITNYETNTIHWSLNKIKQVGDVATEEVMNDRTKNGKYYSVEELFKRVIRKKVNRKVITSLIYSGCMDTLYDIKVITDRIKIFAEYAKLIDEPVSSMVDIKMSKYDYWWATKQKLVSGLGIFDYPKIINGAKLSHKYSFLDAADVQMEDKLGDKCSVCGLVVELNTHKGGKGEFANILINSNDDQVWVTCWSGVWTKLKKDILGSDTTKILSISGRISDDKFKGVQVVETIETTTYGIIDTMIASKSLIKS